MPLKIGDKIELYGGYDWDPLYLRDPLSSTRSGTVIQFIEGQNKNPAAIIKLDQKISGEIIMGDIVVLELRYEEQTWDTPSPVHVELCDFMPEDKSWIERKQGEWVEGAASLRIMT